MRRERTQISKIRNAKGEITTNTMEIQEERDQERLQKVESSPVLMDW
jgi:hypothetical protein